MFNTPEVVCDFFSEYIDSYVTSIQMYVCTIYTHVYVYVYVNVYMYIIYLCIYIIYMYNYVQYMYMYIYGDKTANIPFHVDYLVICGLKHGF